MVFGLKGLQFPIGKEKVHRLVAGVLLGYDGLYHLCKENDFSGMTIESDSVEACNNIWLQQVIFGISQAEYNHHNYDSLPIPRIAAATAGLIERCENQNQFQENFNRFIETLHNCYQEGDATETAAYLRRFEEFLEWSKKGVPVKEVGDAINTILFAVEVHKECGIENACSVYEATTNLIINTLPHTIFLGMPWVPNEKQIYKGSLDYEVIAKDIIEKNPLDTDTQTI